MDQENLFKPRSFWGNIEGEAFPDKYPITIISEEVGSNCTLKHRLCPAHFTGSWSHLADDAQAEFKNCSLPSLMDRLNRDLGFGNTSKSRLDVDDTINLLQMCPFDTIDKTPEKTLSPFCKLFVKSDFEVCVPLEFLTLGGRMGEADKAFRLLKKALIQYTQNGS